MLVYPDNSSSVLTIVSIDPGCTNLGFAAMGIDLKINEIVYTEAFTFNSDKMLSDDHYIGESHTERTEKILAQRNNLVSMFKHYSPNVICCESPFYNALRPAAYGALKEIMSGISDASLIYNPSVNLILYPPSIIKKALGGSAIADKVSVKEQVLKNNEINFRGPYPLTKLDEHAIDAIAVGYCHFKLTKESFYNA